MAVSLNGDGTITGLSTLSSVTITGLTSLTTTDLTADTTTLVVDSANNRVGIGTASPSTTLQVVGTATATAFSGPLTGNVTGDVSGNAGTVTNGVYTTDIGSTVQAYDADLTTLGGLSSADGNFIVGSATGWVVESGATARTSLGLGTAATTASTDYATAAQGTTADSALQPGDIGSTVQAYDADLTALAGLSSADGNFIVGSATGWVAESGATARTSLGLGGLATLSSVDGSTIDDNSVSAAELNVSGNGTSGQALTSDGDGSFSWTTITTSVTPADVSDQNNTSTGYFDLPAGTTAQEPAAGSGRMRYDTTIGAIMFSDGVDWYRLSGLIPTLSSVTGTIYAGIASTLTLAGTSFLSANLVVNFYQASDSIDVNVSVTPSSDTSASVTVPSTVYNNVTGGNTVTVKVTNSDGLTSGGVNKSAVGVPTGGTITTSGSDRIHTFTSSGTFAVPSGFPTTSAGFLIIAGGAGGGVADSGNDCGGGGGGAGGYRSSWNSETSGGGCSAEAAYSITASTNYTVTVGAGGSGAQAVSTVGSNGNNSSVFSKTSTGGGGGSNRGGPAGNGGSGGGGSCTGNNGTGTGCQGYNGGGGAGTGQGATYGGGGAAAVGAVGPGGTGGAGGAGRASTITGSSVTRAGGGGGGKGLNTGGGAGGSGGGGAGGATNGVNGSAATANTGSGGGGGAGYATGSTKGGNGGSGIVVIRYTLP
jgi:hypothetical protein